MLEQIEAALTGHLLSYAQWDDAEISVTCTCGTEVVGQDDGEEANTQEERLFAGHLAALVVAVTEGGKA